MTTERYQQAGIEELTAAVMKYHPLGQKMKPKTGMKSLTLEGQIKNPMDIQAEIKWIQSELSKVRDPSLIEIFVKLLKYRKSAIESSLEEYNRELDEANARIESGKFISQEDLENEASQW